MPRQPRDEALLRAFGDRVRATRSEVGISQERLSELSGLHRTYVGHVERGAVAPTVQTIVRLAQAMNRDPGELLEGLRVEGLPGLADR